MDQIEMADFGIVAVSALTNAGGRDIVALHKDQYNEDEVRKMVLDSLNQIKEKLDKLFYAKFKTVRDVINSWRGSAEPIESEIQMNRLKQVCKFASEAFNTAEDPLDKLRALYFF